MEKRQIASAFQQRLLLLLERKSLSVSAFARECGLDRSALSQFLDSDQSRLPRAETLHSIASSQSVSTDWLLGISQDEENLAQVASISNVESGPYGAERSPIAQWRKEAEGYKIRYAPSSLPDLLRTPAVTKYEFGHQIQDLVQLKSGQTRNQLEYTRLPETDMEVVMPFQRLENLANGVDIWSNLARGIRQAQLERMAVLLRELYPTFRLFLYDGLTHYTSAYTVFGPKRASVYMGNMYLVINATEQIRQLAKHFDNLIRVAEISPDRAADYVESLRVQD